MVAMVERIEGGISPDAYNMAAAVAAQNALNSGKTMAEAVEAAKAAKDSDEAAKPKEAEPAPADSDKVRDYLMCVCQVLHGRFAHLSTQRLTQIASLHPGTGIRSFEAWAADEV